MITVSQCLDENKMFTMTVAIFLILSKEKIEYIASILITSKPGMKIHGHHIINVLQLMKM